MAADTLRGLTALAREFVDLVEVLYDGETSMLTTSRLVSVATHAAEAAEHAAVTVVSDEVLRTDAATSTTASRVDRIAAEVGRGPAFDALHTSSVVVAHDLDTDTSWPELGRRVVAETPVRSILACRIYLAHRHTAALNLYSSWPHAFDATDAATATILAAYCSLALLTQLLSATTPCTPTGPGSPTARSASPSACSWRAATSPPTTPTPSSDTPARP